jgi:tRNA A37 N6-isopentenylltransferase MiaA
MNAQAAKDNIRIALPLMIQVLALVVGGIVFYFQMMTTVRNDLVTSKSEIIRKVDQSENKIEDVAEDVDEIKIEQKAMRDDLPKAIAKDRDLEFTEHLLHCHNSKSTKCDRDP